MAAVRMDARRRLAFREALWIALIALATTGIALAVVYVQTISVVQAQMRGVVEAELDTLLNAYRDEGPAEMRRLVSEAVRDEGANDYFYLLAEADNRPISGDLTRWPTGVPRDGWTSFTVALTSLQGGYTRQVDAHAVTLPNGQRLLVGHLAEGRLRIRDRFVQAMGLAVVVSGLFALLFGYWRSQRAADFVSAVNETGGRFHAGALNERLPVSKANDSFDRLATTVNAAFDATERMVGSLRAATDGMAHDLRTPLTRVRARLELARMREQLPPAADELLGDADRDLSALLALIDDLLRLTRAEATNAGSFVELDLAAPARDVAELYAPVAEDKGVALAVSAAPAPARGAPPLLSQLAANLIDNAVKYTPAGGRVRVATGADGEASWLRVEDTGPGIAPVDRARALTRFVRLDASRHTPGTGLGLSLVDAIARVHGASLALTDAAPGQEPPGLLVEVRFSAAG